MGFIIKQPLETNQGLLSEAYVRIEKYTVDMFYGTLTATVAMYPSKQAAIETFPVYYGEVNPNPSQIIGVNIIYKEKEIEYTTLFEIPLVKEVDVEIPYYEDLEEVETSNYYDFDEKGDIVEKTREVRSTTKVLAGTQIVSKLKIDINQNDGKIYKYAYSLIKEHFGEIFGNENIIDE
jgi:hypothetical protein